MRWWSPKEFDDACSSCEVNGKEVGATNVQYILYKLMTRRDLIRWCCSGSFQRGMSMSTSKPRRCADVCLDWQGNPVYRRSGCDVKIELGSFSSLNGIDSLIISQPLLFLPSWSFVLVGVPPIILSKVKTVCEIQLRGYQELTKLHSGSLQLLHRLMHERTPKISSFNGSRHTNRDIHCDTTVQYGKMANRRSENNIFSLIELTLITSISPSQ